MESELQVLAKDSLVKRLVGPPEPEEKKTHQTQDTSKLELMKESSCDRREIWKHQRKEQWIKILNDTNIRSQKLRASALLNWSAKRYQGLQRLTNDTLPRWWLERRNAEDRTKISWRIPDSAIEQPSSKAHTMNNTRMEFHQQATQSSVQHGNLKCQKCTKHTSMIFPENHRLRAFYTVTTSLGARTAVLEND